MPKKVQKGRRTDEERILDVLGDGELHSNQAVRQELGWSEEKYERLRNQYIAKGLIVVGRGRGGSVGGSLRKKPMR